jgi:mono/diheme cytochrome c family protein
MRDALELIEKIERYLSGALTQQEAHDFEAQMKVDPALSEAVSAQRDLMQGISRAAISADVKGAAKRYHASKRLTRWSLWGVGGLILIALSFLFVWKQHWFAAKPGISVSAYSGNQLPMLNEKGGKDWATADSVIPAQVFDIAAGKDTVVETRGGIVFAIPAGTFVTAGGKAVSGAVQLCIKEAMDPLTIMTARLRTRSGDKLLETGGMFFIDARQGDDILSINPSAGIYAQLPCEAPKPGMQLFKGKRMPNGSIDWIEPQALPQHLLSVDINSLDLYPPGYLDMLSHDGYPTTSRRFTDSVYYSLAAFFRESLTADRPDNKASVSDMVDYMASDTSKPRSRESYLAGQALFRRNCATCHNPVVDATGPALGGKSRNWPSRQWVYDWVHNPSAMVAKGDKYANEIFGKYKPTIMTAFPDLSNEQIDAIVQYADEFDGMCGINPAKVKAIWNNKFQNTLLATREFEARMKIIHASKGPGLLDLYVANLDRNLYEIDSIAATAATDSRIVMAFRNAAAERKGKVSKGSKQLEALKVYYTQKTDLYTDAAAAAMRKVLLQQAGADKEAWQRTIAHQSDQIARIESNFQQELELNLESAYSQLGKARPSNLLASADASYTILVTNTGWNNVDRYVMESTATRTTMNYMDEETGKKAVITYNPITLTIANSAAYDRLLVYLVPDKISSFINLQDSSGKFSESLNSLLKYDLVCIGLKGTQYSYLHMENIKAKAYEDLKLEATDSASFIATINSLRIIGQSTALRKEIEYARRDIRNIQQQQQRLKWETLIADLKRTLFDCGYESEEKVERVSEAGLYDMR